MKVLFFANTEWYLYNFRFGLARSLREQGTEVVMMSPYGAYGSRIETAGFRWYPLPMDRCSLNLVRELTLLRRISDIFRIEKPDVIHNFTIKCVVYGSLVARWLGVSRRINAVTGLGHIFISDSLQARLLRPLVKSLLRLALSSSESRLILQNADDVRLFLRLAWLRTNGFASSEAPALIPFVLPRSNGSGTLKYPHKIPLRRQLARRAL